MEREENVTSDVWELEGGVVEEQQELPRFAPQLVSIPEEHSVEEIH